MTYSTPALKRVLFHDFSPHVLLWFHLGHINTENNPVNFLSVRNHISNWCLTTRLCWKPISVRHEWTNPVWRFLGWGDALRYLMYFTPSWDCYANSGTAQLVRWQFKQIPHSFLDGCFWWLPQGSIERARQDSYFQTHKVWSAGLWNNPVALILPAQ